VGRTGKRVLSPLSFHSLRHTTTSMLKASGAPESIVRDIIGHESAAVSRQYTHVEPAAKRDAMSKMPSFGTPPSG
jgi:integrase